MSKITDALEAAKKLAENVFKQGIWAGAQDLHNLITAAEKELAEPGGTVGEALYVFSNYAGGSNGIHVQDVVDAIRRIRPEPQSKHLNVEDALKQIDDLIGGLDSGPFPESRKPMQDGLKLARKIVERIRPKPPVALGEVIRRAEMLEDWIGPLPFTTWSIKWGRPYQEVTLAILITELLAMLRKMEVPPENKLADCTIELLRRLQVYTLVEDMPQEGPDWAACANAVAALNSVGRVYPTDNPDLNHARTQVIESPKPEPSPQVAEVLADLENIRVMWMKEDKRLIQKQFFDLRSKLASLKPQPTVKARELGKDWDELFDKDGWNKVTSDSNRYPKRIALRAKIEEYAGEEMPPGHWLDCEVTAVTHIQGEPTYFYPARHVYVCRPEKSVRPIKEIEAEYGTLMMSVRHKSVSNEEQFKIRNLQKEHDEAIKISKFKEKDKDKEI